MSAIDRLRNGYTAGASDPSAAHDEFDRLVRLAGLDADHAAALEREAIAAWLDGRAAHIKSNDVSWDHRVVTRVAQVIRNGDHWKEAQ